MFIRFYGIDYVISFQAIKDLENVINLKDQPLNENLKVNDEDVILIRRCSQKSIALITTNRVRLLSEDLQSVVAEYIHPKISLASIE